LATIVIRSDEANAAATALLFATRDHAVCLLGSPLGPGEHDFSFLGNQRTVTLRSVEDLAATGPRVGVVYAEGESVTSGIESVLQAGPLDLLVIVGGGISAAVEATESARSTGFDRSRILHVGGFIVRGNAASVKGEKQGVLASFLADGTPESVEELAKTTFPQISIGQGYAVALSSVNAMVHVPPMIFNAMNIERGEQIRFYVEGFGDSVARLIEYLDADRLRLGAALGVDLLPVGVLLDRYRGPEYQHDGSLREKVNAYPPYQSTKLPSTFSHRFLAHELRSTFAPMSALASSLGVDVPTIGAAVRMGEVLLGEDLQSEASVLAEKFLSLTEAKYFSGT